MSISDQRTRLRLVTVGAFDRQAVRDLRAGKIVGAQAAAQRCLNAAREETTLPAAGAPASFIRIFTLQVRADP